MPESDLPGYQFTMQHGYNNVRADSTPKLAKYSNGMWNMIVSADGDFRLYKLLGIVEVSTQPNYISCNNFHEIERQFRDVDYRCGGCDNYELTENGMQRKAGT